MKTEPSSSSAIYYAFLIVSLAFISKLNAVTCQHSTYENIPIKFESVKISLFVLYTIWHREKTPYIYNTNTDIMLRCVTKDSCSMDDT